MHEAEKKYIEQLVEVVAKKMVEAFEGLTIEDVNMYKLGYNKAIDDFAERITLPLTEESIFQIVEEMKNNIEAKDIFYNDSDGMYYTKDGESFDTREEALKHLREEL